MSRRWLTLLEPHSRFGDKLLGNRVNLSPKRDCGSKRLSEKNFDAGCIREPRMCVLERPKFHPKCHKIAQSVGCFLTA